MTELLPGVQVSAIQASTLDYLATTFALADEEARGALLEFLADRERGIFKGPYLRVRLPFKAADPGWREALEWYEGPAPYGHQAAAFTRLSSLDAGPGKPAKPRPLPTLVTTGTGSGKTEAFLHPILDHVLRAKRRGVTGTKALILYPMNALANDQAQRLADLITSHAALGGVTAALYTGEGGSKRKVVSSKGLITDREEIRANPPDLLLTNYKMLDQLLLRPADQSLWAQSATSLQYLVLDEFHTYDGAQGTDVSMLLRRLGLALKSHWPDGAFSDADRSRPLGIVTPVATSATLGDKDDPAAMLEFARTVFGEDFGQDAVVTESRLSVEEWIGDATTLLSPRTDREALQAVVDAAGTLNDGRTIATTVLGSLFTDAADKTPDLSDADDAALLTLVKAHPFTRSLVEAAEQAQTLPTLVEQILPAYAADDTHRRLAEDFLLLYSATLSHVRKSVGRTALSIDLHLWVRELSRIDRMVSGTPSYLWSDDTHLVDPTREGGGLALPAVYCRHCGRSGWAVQRAPIGGFDLTAADPGDIRRARVRNDPEFRVLIHAPAEEAELDELDPDVRKAKLAAQDPDEPGVRWLVVDQRRVLAKPPADEDSDAATAAGRVLPVLVHDGPSADRFSLNDTCPSCMQKDGIRFLGSAIATLLSVSLSTIFGTEELDKSEKKALIFTDSVQDAAHRAGFVQSRSHRLTLRAVLRSAVGEEPVSLDLLVDRVLQQAGDDPHRRYRILPPDFADQEKFEDFWRSPRQARVPSKVRSRVKRRLLFDTVMEFGLASRLGRTLEVTGSLAAEVDVSRPVMVKVAAEVEKAIGPDHLGGLGVAEGQLLGWVRGVLERLRTDGAITHEWFRKYQSEDGRRYSIWGGRPRSDGMPAFPRGRPAPAYPRIGSGSPDSGGDIVPAASSRGWYAVWTGKVLGCTPSEGASLIVALLKGLADVGVLNAVHTQSGALVYELPQAGILVAPVGAEDLESGRHLLTCDTCSAAVPGSHRVVDEMAGTPCLVLRCPGRHQPTPLRSNSFYRQLYGASDATRVVAREHTGLLPDEDRLRYETEFKTSAENPQAPNVLVATPTLEMGIDIGDLSTVMLASLPRSVASYLQRVGRAGRLTGSALNLAFVSGRGEQLPRLGDPLSVVNGQVRPPATYLDAEEILRRQYVASVADRLARDPRAPQPFSTPQAIGSVEPGTFLHAVIGVGELSETCGRFLSCFDSLSPEARQSLVTWAQPAGEAGTSPMAVFLHEQRHRWHSRVEALKQRLKEIQKELPELRTKAQGPAATDDDRVALRTSETAVKLTRAELTKLLDSYWIGVLEEYGILPNYTLLDDSVTLEVQLSWIDPDTQDYRTDEATLSRRAALALREFAPGARFYAFGYRIEVDAVDLGTGSESVRERAFCPSCGYSCDVSEGRAGTCPRCGDAGLADVSQRLEVVELERVTSAMRREEAVIDDARDERDRVPFTIVTAADIVPARHEWFVDNYPFGVKHLTGMTIRWINLGRIGEPSSGTRLIAGEEVTAPLFRVCESCGKLDGATGVNQANEHRPWCPRRRAASESVRSIALSRTLVTEGVVLQIPPVLSVGDPFAVPSLMAAVHLGLREHLGGAPDHLDLVAIADPYLSDGTENREALLLHDTVPGGTGYLAEFADPAHVYAVFRRAWEIVRDCPCQDENRAACHRCLSPFINGITQKWVSRASAERSLRTLLLGGAGDSDPGEPAEEMAWQVVTTQTAAYEPETHIEQRFRTVLETRLTTGLGASVAQQPGPNGVRWTINAGNGRIWTLEPQLQLGGVQPDFVLISNDQTLPRMAIFCDGWQYHASAAHNRLADDTRKRAALRAGGDIVVAVTWQDLIDAASGPVTAPAWHADARWTKVLQAMGGRLKPGHLDLVKGGPVDLIAQWIQSPDPDGFQALAEALPMLLIGAGPTGKAAGSADLPDLARSVHDTGNLPNDGDKPVWGWSNDTVAVLARPVGNTPADTEVVVLIDDRAERLGESHKAAWNDWLRLSNLLNLRLQETVITTWRELAEARQVIGSPGQKEAIEPLLPDGWSDLRDHAVAEEEKRLVAELAFSELAAIPLPAQGYETLDGLPIALCWPDAKVAVDFDMSPEDRTDLVADGWSIVAPDPFAIVSALGLVGGR